MIPAFSKENVTYKDQDNTSYTFLPKTGILERELVAAFSTTEDSEQTVKKMDELIDKILIAPVKEGQKASDLYNSEEKMEIIKYWNAANRLTVPEKKS